MVDQLTRAAFEAGEPCPGCGVPWQGSLVDLCMMEVDALELMRAGPIAPADVLFDRHVDNLVALGLVRREDSRLAITSRGRKAAAALRREAKRWTDQHGNCRAGRHRIANGPTHCMKCCPPPPLSDQQIQEIAALLR
jgi:hypothetical protein